MNAPITIEQVLAGKLFENGHLNYGKAGHGYMLQHRQLHRLSAVDRFYKGDAAAKAGRSSERIWYVDMRQMPSLDAAVEALNVPAVFTDEERGILALLSVEFEPRRVVVDRLEAAGVPPDGIMSALILLRHKGAVEMSRVLGGDDRAPIPTIRRRQEA